MNVLPYLGAALGEILHHLANEVPILDSWLQSPFIQTVSSCLAALTLLPWFQGML